MHIKTRSSLMSPKSCDNWTKSSHTLSFTTHSQVNTYTFR